MHHIPKAQSITSILLFCLACTTITGTSIEQEDSKPASTIRTNLLNNVTIVYSKEWDKLKDPSNAAVGALNITEESDIDQLNQYRKIFESKKNNRSAHHSHHPIVVLIMLHDAKKNHNIYQEINNTAFNKNPYHLLPISIILDKVSDKIQCIDIKKSLCMRTNNKITIADISLFCQERKLKNNTKLHHLLPTKTSPSHSNHTNKKLEIFYSLSEKYISAFQRREVQKNNHRLQHFLHITEKKAIDTPNPNISTKGIEQRQAIHSEPEPMIKLRIKLKKRQFSTCKKMFEHINANHLIKKEYTFENVTINRSVLSVKETLMHALGNSFHKKYLNLTYNGRQLKDSQTLRKIVRKKNSKEITLQYNLIYFPLLYTLAQHVTP